MIIGKCIRSRPLYLVLKSNYHNFYDTLQVDHGASQMDIKRKFYQLAKKHHPDSQAGLKDPAEFIRIKEAYETLGDEKKRKRYDNSFYSQTHEGHSSYNEYEASRTGFRTANANYYDPYIYAEERISMWRILKENCWTVFFYMIYAYMGIQVWRFCLKKMDQKDREFKQMLVDNNPSVSQRRKKYYMNQMKQRKIYAKTVDIKFRTLEKESTRQMQKRKESMTSIVGIHKDSDETEKMVRKPDYM